mmetsp:Transcript_93037/g.165479  ORF Transcript_93037/g.165479 Transcript_93037/m.165479 type:complete len:262 (+) Transcript_93037:63-848(+)|eukprot:CAMPEP_0197660356 /NCGR_PEP_ID=MMETSP1338-20131121/50799_1 /TAXON_ID=43686 ORGANISM="Pelagodinium beii, Strain RCC1491" /NCGR_SAMPLE_ID=MMETSP1338 /ASSEMBLY_ACC=CAM_ASM_000754 /LENGTH=261 /DNA_ID=CAMNT_0043237691 /DNA_START=45 /DNA_END=830 /DNA_ORIENTATION=+
MAHAAAAVTGARRAGRRPNAGVSNWLQEQKLERFRREIAVKEKKRSDFARENPEKFLVNLGLGDCLAASRRRLSITVTGHVEERGNTVYSIRCGLHVPDNEKKMLTWVCKHRLCEMREQFNDVVMKALDTEYAAFDETPFALRGGLPGTTARLVAWFETLAKVINAGGFSHQIAAQLMNSLQGPIISEGGEVVAAAAPVNYEFRPTPVLRFDPIPRQPTSPSAAGNLSSAAQNSQLGREQPADEGIIGEVPPESDESGDGH